MIQHKTTPPAAITERAALGGLMRAIDGYQGQPETKIGLELLALMTCRPGELRHATWPEFDLEAEIWSIPAERMKMRRSHRVPLPARCLALLAELRLLSGAGTYLLPSLRTWKEPMTENTLNAALHRMDFTGEEMTSHGFRATFSTLANESGLWNPDATERALAHIEANEVRRAYARGEYWEERVRMNLNVTYSRRNTGIGRTGIYNRRNRSHFVRLVDVSCPQRGQVILGLKNLEPDMTTV